MINISESYTDGLERRWLGLMANQDEKIRYDVGCRNENCIYMTDIFIEELRDGKYYKCNGKKSSLDGLRAQDCVYREEIYKSMW